MYKHVTPIYNALVRVIYSVVSGQYLYTIPADDPDVDLSLLWLTRNGDSFRRTLCTIRNGSQLSKQINIFLTDVKLMTFVPSAWMTSAVKTEQPEVLPLYIG